LKQYPEKCSDLQWSTQLWRSVTTKQDVSRTWIGFRSNRRRHVDDRG